MNISRSAIGLLALFIAAGCTPVSTPTVASSSASPSEAAATSESPDTSPPPTATPGPTQSPTQAPTPSATVDPLTAQDAGTAFQAAFRTFGRVLEMLNETHRDAACAWAVGIPDADCTASQIPIGMEVWTTISNGLDAFVTDVESIRFTDAVADDVASVLDALIAAQLKAHEVTDSDTLETFNARADAAIAAQRAATEPIQALLDALGVPALEAP
jgi:hypothetical protein